MTSQWIQWKMTLRSLTKEALPMHLRYVHLNCQIVEKCQFARALDLMWEVSKILNFEICFTEQRQVFTLKIPG